MQDSNTSKYWRGRFGKSMPTVNYSGREWGVEPEKKTRHEGGVKTASRGAMELTRDNTVVYSSSHAYVDTSGNVQILRCACKPERAAQRRHRCQGCRCLGDCTLSCGCQGRCWLPPPTSLATDATSTDNTAAVNIGTRRRRHNGRGGSTANRERGGSAALRPGSEANGARKAPGVDVNHTHGGAPFWRDGGRVMGEGSDPRTDPTSRNCSDGEGDGPSQDESKFSAGIWIGDSDSECSGSEGEDSASEAGKDHDDEFVF
ncbi:unnamed protein product [Sphacelaria rigidula]